MNKRGFTMVPVLITIAVFLIGGSAYYYGTHRTPQAAPQNTVGIVVNSPKPNDIVILPITVTGQIKGNGWFANEGETGVVQIFDANNKAISNVQVLKATTDWLKLPTEFQAIVGDRETMSHIATPTGYLKFSSKGEKSGSTAQSFIVPIQFTGNNTPPDANTYTYKNHGFTIELPKGYVPKEDRAEGGPQIVITLPGGSLSYYGDASWWETNVSISYNFAGDKKIGTTTFKVYNYSEHKFYWFKQGNVGYEFNGPDAVVLENLLKTFKFVGWSSENTLAPAVNLISPNPAYLGSIIQINGKNLSGFEGDKNAWIVDSRGIKGILYGEQGSTDNLIRTTLKSQLCQKDNSYSGKPCDAWLTLTSGTYKIYVQTPNGKSNEVNFTIYSGIVY